MLDSFLAASQFGVEWNALDLSQPCEFIETIKYVATEAMLTFSNPLRKLARELLPFTPYAVKYRHAQTCRQAAMHAENIYPQLPLTHLPATCCAPRT